MQDKTKKREHKASYTKLYAQIPKTASWVAVAIIMLAAFSSYDLSEQEHREIDPQVQSAQIIGSGLEFGGMFIALGAATLGAYIFAAADRLAMSRDNIIAHQVDDDSSN